jgi:mitochondrial fission protein ELM1
MTPFRILILSDGRAGHFNLSEGIAAAVERLGRAETRRVEVRRGGWPGAVLAALTRSRLPARRMLAAVYGVEAQDLPQCDLIVSAGAETLAANVWLARMRGKPNLFYGSLRLFRPDDFALVLTSYARQVTSPKHALALKPSRLDPDSLGTPPEPPGRSLPQTLGFLIGGDAGPIQFRQEDWAAILSLIRTTGRDGGVRWLVANSRRTPDHFSDALAAEARLTGSPIASFLDVRSSGPGTLPQILGPSAAVLCTADSSSMLSEAIWARRPVIEVEPHRCPLTADEAEYRAWLRRSNWCGTLTIRSATPASLASALGSIRPASNNPQAELAQLIRQRLSLDLG